MIVIFEWKRKKDGCIKKQCASFTLSNPFVLWRNPLFFSNKTFFLCSTVLSASGGWKRVITAYFGSLYVQIDISNGQKINVLLPNMSIRLRTYRVQSQSLKLAWFDPSECHRVVALDETVLYQQQKWTEAKRSFEIKQVLINHLLFFRKRARSEDDLSIPYLLLDFLEKKKRSTLTVSWFENQLLSEWMASVAFKFYFWLKWCFFLKKKKYFLNKVEFMMMNCFMKNKKVCDYSWRHLISLFCIPLFLCKTPC